MRSRDLWVLVPVLFLAAACSSSDAVPDGLVEKAEADYEERGEMGDAGDVEFVEAEREGDCVAVVFVYPEERGGQKVIVPMRLADGGDEDDLDDWEVLGFPSGRLDQLDGELERCGYP